MKILVIDNNTSFLEEIKKILEKVEYKIIYFKDFKYEDSKEFTHIILTGGNQKLDLDLFKEECELIKNSSKPILGICFGHQLISKIFGANHVKMDFRREGFFSIRILKKDPVFEGLRGLINVYQYHLYFMKDFGEELICLGESNFKNEIIKHRDKKLYGFQFHLEKSVDGRKLIQNFLKLQS